MNLADIRSARDRRDYESALNGCRHLLDLDPENLDVLRLKATVLMMMKCNGEALADHQAIIGSRSIRTADYFLGANTAFVLGEYDLGCSWLDRALELDAKNDDRPYTATVRFLRAYGLMQLERYEEALCELAIAERESPTIALPLPGESGIASARHLRAEIVRRKG
jgi:tetratricopeptide (TPR) repeat protein